MKKNKNTNALNYLQKKDFKIRQIESEDREGRIAERRADKSILRKVCSDDEIKNIESDFNNFYKIVFDNCLDEEIKEKLLMLKEDIKQNYFIYMYLLIDFSPARQILKVRDSIREVNLLEPDPITKEKMISMARQHLFFLADLVIASVIGDNKILNKLIKRNEEMTGKKLSVEKKKVLKKIIDKRNELKNKEDSSHKFSWRVAINNLYPKLSEKEKRSLLGIDLKQNIDIPNRLTKNHINTISETISYHKKMGNLPK